ncbi:hypothetical protein PP301_gp104 [Gordonia phage GMA2]|uniref:Uncharacterized protein n=1 Tax=Gordonia phage GMA2 TaxID=1647283 RepID=A0A0K0N789_9CAUD|nr:hypothetical protein PP301_gp104 [Gordonia phage GMA2]AKJ72618.1 hypothetical protein GMA2_80 [Gordonia phage GMA2]
MSPNPFSLAVSQPREPFLLLPKRWVLTDHSPRRPGETRRPVDFHDTPMNIATHLHRNVRKDLCDSIDEHALEQFESLIIAIRLEDLGVAQTLAETFSLSIFDDRDLQ